MTKNTGTAGAVVKCAAFWGHDGKVLADFYAAALGGRSPRPSATPQR
ncbi:hypothetical protein QZH56_35235 [Streptomyces olivoreticuli]|nr:hypothetical protein [Streptomyces olivoreticuli]WKK23887.1 hypothetical protein QZH56_35235 [Streptomyces olivoreticuli]